MAIPLSLSEVPAVTPYVQYIATNGQTVFPYPFPITQDSDLIVVYNGVTLATDAGYTLSGQGNDTGGNVTFTAGATAGDIVTLYRDITIERLTQIGQNSGFASSAFNAEFNNIYLILQQLEASIGQCLQIPNTNNPPPTTGLTPSAYAGKYLAFDPNGNPAPAALTSSGSLTGSIIAALLNLVTATAPTADKVRTAAEIAASVTPVNYAYAPLNTLRYGAKGDGTTDDTAALQAAVSVLSHQPDGELHIPAGYSFLVSQVTFSHLSNFNVRCDGVVISSAAKPGAAGVDMRGTDSGLFSPLKFDTCTNFKVRGAGYIQNGFVEPLFFTSCSDFDVSLDCRGNGTNDNLSGLYCRFCTQFRIHDMTLDGVTKYQANAVTYNYLAWSNNIQVWDCSGFVISGLVTRKAGYGGIYVGSNCFDFAIENNLVEFNSGTGCQITWSSFGVPPARYTVTGNIFRNNQADGFDIDNLSGAAASVMATVTGNTALFNGWLNNNPAGGVITADGSGMTLQLLNDLTVSDNVINECSRSGIFLDRCAHAALRGNLIFKSITGSTQQGLYVNGGTDVDVTGNTVIAGTTEAIKLDSGSLRISIRGNTFVGPVSFPTPGSSGANGTVTYTGVVFAENKCEVSVGINVVCNWRNGSVAYSGTGTALTIAADSVGITGVQVTAPGTGAVGVSATGINNPGVNGCNIVAQSQALIMNNCNSPLVQGNYLESTAGATLQLLGTTDRAVVVANRAKNDGSANSFRAEATTTNTSIMGNQVVAGSAGWLGTMQLNFS